MAKSFRDTSTKEKSDKEKGQRKECHSIWLIPYLIKHLKFLQGRVLKVSENVLEASNWVRSSKSSVQEVSVGHIPFLHVVLTCIRDRAVAIVKIVISDQDQVQAFFHLRSD